MILADRKKKDDKILSTEWFFKTLWSSISSNDVKNKQLNISVVVVKPKSPFEFLLLR